MKHYFYHITERTSLPKIMEKGLVPQIGPRSGTVFEEEPMVCLGKRKDMPYWQILLGILQDTKPADMQQPVILQVDVEEDELEKFEYSYYDEYAARKPIPPEKLKRGSFVPVKKEHMRNLCGSYLYSLSRLTIHLARYYNDMWAYGKPCVEGELNAMLEVFPYLDYSTMTWGEIRREIREAGDGGCTFCDRYLYTDHRLWEQLILYPEDDLSERREKLYKMFKKTFTPGCLHVETGGWSGTW